MDQLNQDIRTIKEDISEIKTTLAVNTKSLEHHIARTDASERRIEKVEFILITGFIVTVLGGVAKLLIDF